MINDVDASFITGSFGGNDRAIVEPKYKFPYAEIEAGDTVYIDEVTGEAISERAMSGVKLAVQAPNLYAGGSIGAISPTGEYVFMYTIRAVEQTPSTPYRLCVSVFDKYGEALLEPDLQSSTVGYEIDNNFSCYSIEWSNDPLILFAYNRTGDIYKVDFTQGWNVQPIITVLGSISTNRDFLFTTENYHWYRASSGTVLYRVDKSTGAITTVTTSERIQVNTGDPVLIKYEYGYIVLTESKRLAVFNESGVISSTSSDMHDNYIQIDSGTILGIYNVSGTIHLRVTLFDGILFNTVSHDLGFLRADEVLMQAHSNRLSWRYCKQRELLIINALSDTSNKVRKITMAIKLSGINSYQPESIKFKETTLNFDGSQLASGEALAKPSSTLGSSAHKDITFLGTKLISREHMLMSLHQWAYSPRGLTKIGVALNEREVLCNEVTAFNLADSTPNGFSVINDNFAIKTKGLYYKEIEASIYGRDFTPAGVPESKESGGDALIESKLKVEKSISKRWSLLVATASSAIDYNHYFADAIDFFIITGRYNGNSGTEGVVNTLNYSVNLDCHSLSLSISNSNQLIFYYEDKS